MMKISEEAEQAINQKLRELGQTAADYGLRAGFTMGMTTFDISGRQDSWSRHLPGKKLVVIMTIDNESRGNHNLDQVSNEMFNAAEPVLQKHDKPDR